MAVFTIANRTTAIGKTFRVDRQVTTDGAVFKDPTLPGAKTGSLTTRTDDGTGTLTMDSGHGILDGDKVAIFWAGGSRYNVTVGTVATNSVPIGLGGGDNLPAQGTAVTVMVLHEEAFAVEYDHIQGLFCGQPQGAAVVEFWSAVPALIAAIQITNDADYVWTVNDGTANPLNANVAKVKLAHAGTTSRQVTAAAFIN
jgi:hypothetical protein